MKTEIQSHEYDISLYGSDEIVNSLALLYHENSKLSSYGMRMLGERIGAFSIPYTAKRALQPYKIYPNSKCICLASSVSNSSIDSIKLSKLLLQRKSTRTYDASYILSKGQLATLLYHTYGVTSWQEVYIGEERVAKGRRNIPSAGGLYPLEIYVITLHSEIPSGLYHYNAKDNRLELIHEGDYKSKLLTSIQAEPYVDLSSSSVVILITAFPERQMIKYGERAYRFLQAEVGSVTQMLSLLAEAEGLGSCIMGGYNDDELNDILEIDGLFECIQSVMIVGKENRYE